MKGPSFLNLMSGVFLVLTGLLLLAYLVILINPYVPFNLFPPGGVAWVSRATPTPTTTPTFTVFPPTWTFTPMPTETPIPPPTPTRTPTLTPSPTPTWPPTATPTPRATRAPYPFTCEVTYRANLYGIPWAGVAGHLQDLDGNPLPGYHVAVNCPGIPETFDHVAGADARYNLMYESGAAWERACDPSTYRALDIRVRIFDKYPSPDGTFRPVSDWIQVQLGDWATRSLGYVTCTLNWEEWRNR